MRNFLFVVIIATMFSSCTLIRQPQGGLKIDTSMPATVYLDDKNMGSTPFILNPLDVKKYQLRVVPTDGSLVPYETVVKVFSNFETTVDWQFATTGDASSGFIFEEGKANSAKLAELEIVTSPDNVPISINGKNEGFSPLVLDKLTQGDYKLELQAPGYISSSRDVRLIQGKRLVITAKLARKPLAIATPSAQLAPLPTPSPSAVPKATPKSMPSATITTAKPYIEVLDTPTGYLKVRGGPSTMFPVLGQLDIGDTVPYDGQETVDHWFKIAYEATNSAWVSGQYSKLVE